MIKRITTLILTLFCVYTAAWANEEHSIVLEKGDKSSKTIELGYGIISFRLVGELNNYKVDISLDNITNSQALLIFKNSHGEKELKKNRPKVEFDKTFPGSKGNKSVFGWKELSQPMLIVIPQIQSGLAEVEISSTSPVNLEVPIYIAKYDPKKLTKKGKDNTDYKILSEEILTFNIELKGWSEDDPAYMSVRDAVREYLQSLKSAAFCRNTHHTPSLSQQQKPYQEKKDSLIKVIETTLQNHPEWFAEVHAPHIAYSELYKELKQVNLDDHNYDCGNHKIPPKKHSCGYCTLSAQEIYHQLDDLFQLRQSGKISKADAEKKAKALYNCYQNSTNRKKDNFYGSKISDFYNRLAK